VSRRQRIWRGNTYRPMDKKTGEVLLWIVAIGMVRVGVVELWKITVPVVAVAGLLTWAIRRGRATKAAALPLKPTQAVKPAPAVAPYEFKADPNAWYRRYPDPTKRKP